MADERRRIVYELLVEAKGADQANQQIGAMGKGFKQLLEVAKPAMAVFSAGFIAKGIADSLDELTKFNAQLATLGVTGEAASNALHRVQDVAFVTGQSMRDVTTAYGEAIELQQILGRNTESATRTTESFVKIAAAEGKTAADAARQIQMLAFAIESGNLKSKEFISLLKESNTFQQAAEQALGKTTKQLVEMAKQGDITAAQLVEIVLALEKIGAEKTAQATFTGLWESLKTLGTVAVQATAEAAGFNAKISGSQQTGFQMFLDGVRETFDGIGGAIAAVNNILQGFWDVASGITMTVLHALDPRQAIEWWNYYTAEVNKDLGEAWEGAKRFLRALNPFDGPTEEDWNKYHEQVKKDLEEQTRLARDVGFQKSLGGAFGTSFDRSVAIWKKGQKDAAAIREQMAKDEERRERERARRQEMIWDNREEFAKKTAKDMDDWTDKGMEQLGKDLAAQNIKDLDAAITNMAESTLPNLTRYWMDNFEQMGEVTQTLEYSLSDLFTGGIHSAREFFQVLTRGIADIFAQLAAKQAAEGIMDFLNFAVGAFSFKPSKGTSQFTSSGRDLDRYGDWLGARGGAFRHGHVMALASGGVVNGATPFAMANGGVGVMGEAGPEAVMPLRRTSSGKLGVSGSMPSITVVNKLGVAASARMERSNDRMSLVLEAANMGANMAEARMNRSLRSGYGDTAQSIQRSYGLRRRT